MQHILITGREGQLGNTFFELSRGISWADFSFTTEEELDLTSPNAIDKFFEGKQYDVIINCAAYTAVDKAESDTETACQINAEAPARLAEKASDMGARMVHISTDYVFGHNQCRPLKPDDLKAPVSVYGKSKLKGEEALMSNCPESMIIRTSWLYSLYGKNFLKTMLKLGRERDSLKVVFDQVGTPTLAGDLANTILDILESTISDKQEFVPGIYHYSNEGVCSWYDFAVAIFNETNITCKVEPVESNQFPAPAPRPYYSVMDKSLIKSVYHTEIPHWQESLKKCLRESPGTNELY